MNKQQRLNQLNQFHEGYRLTEEQIVAEYKQMYHPEVTPWSNPELFDPLNPPTDWEYDAWHAVWYKKPTQSQVNMDVFIVWASFALSIMISAFVTYRTYLA
jgi:hypothetical protein